MWRLVSHGLRPSLSRFSWQDLKDLKILISILYSWSFIQKVKYLIKAVNTWIQYLLESMDVIPDHEILQFTLGILWRIRIFFRRFSKIWISHLGTITSTIYILQYTQTATHISRFKMFILFSEIYDPLLAVYTIHYKCISR